MEQRKRLPHQTYTFYMSRFALLSCALIAVLSYGAPLDQLNTTLLQLRDAHSLTKPLRNQIVSEVFALGDRRTAPRRPLVENFVDELTASLAGKNLSAAEAGKLSNAVQAVMLSAGASSVDFKTSLETFEASLTGLGIAPARAKSLSALLAAVGRDIRGPEDVPVA